MDQEHKQLLDGLEKTLKYLNTIHNDIRSLDEKYLRSDAWRIYHEVLNKDLNGLGDKVRGVEQYVRDEIKRLETKFDDKTEDIKKTNQKQDIAFTRLSTKIATIIGIVGGLGGLGALLLRLLGGGS